ncbi:MULTISPECIES: hypothetical protein [Streptomyces]|uniref:hypothetical protein n=1 Tax=Streptomyces TaxID=1883 RepID=UPI0031E2032C
MTKLPTAAVPSPRPAGQAGRKAVENPPIFQALAERWREAGRLVPGDHDPDWARLTGEPPVFDPWRRHPRPQG